ncbi:MAG: DEAD/DEAH box helicase family protein [Thermoplasmata archaeon]|nr:DEAD/DEAH box helicase family protein [Thermoplasmata archaeon]
MEFVEFVEMDNIKPHRIMKRDYQINIFNSIKDKNSLVVLPTGLGKTIIAIMMIAYKIKYGKILFLAPTKPLCEQHYATIKELTTIEGVFLVTGEKTKKEKRKKIYQMAKVIVATPQTIENDLDVINLKEFSLAIFDEAHRAVGNYAYVTIAKACLEQGVQILGLTASPGSDFSRLKEVITNLGIENIEVRSEEDADVKPYIPERKLRWKVIDMPPEIKIIAKKIDELIMDFLIELNKYFKVSLSPKRVTKKMLIQLQEKIQKRMANEGGSLYQAISVVSALIKIYHLKEMLTSQGIEAAKNYIKKIELDTSKAGKKIRQSSKYRQIRDAILSVKPSNPKLEITKKILMQHFATNQNARAIVFAEYRDTIDVLHNELNKLPGIRAAKFIGQAKGSGDGMSQDEQKRVIKLFKSGFYNVLISTSIGEEGIDIPATSLVIFYEPVPSAIRHIQRRGRTARGGMPGEVYILIMKGSRDEAYYWSSRRKEKKMMVQIKKLRDRINEMIEKRKEEKKIVVDAKGQAKLDSWL